MAPSEDYYLEFIRTGWTPALEERLLIRRHALQSAGLKIMWKGEPLEWKIGWAEDLKFFMKDVEIDS